MTETSAPILLVGCGKMGDAMLKGWLSRGIDTNRVIVVEPGAAAAKAAGARGVRVVADIGSLDNSFVPRVVVFAIKPQVMAAAIPAYRRFVGPQTAFLTIAAGKTLGFFAARLGDAASVMRAMPNTPAAIGRGISVLCANRHASADDRRVAEDLLGTVGAVAWVDDESLMDAVTAVSGSGPAYVFYLIECLAEAGVVAGLPARLAEQLARVTVEGAAALSHEDGAAPSTLRENVAAPGGTTEAALGVLMDKDGLQKLINQAVAAAASRSRELAD